MRFDNPIFLTDMSDSYLCRICKEKFNGIDHVPILLPCLHVFGKGCLIKEINASKFKCPECFLSVDAHNITDNKRFPIVKNFIETPATYHGGRCGFCKTEKSEYFCFACSCALCKNCYDMHFKFRFITHIIVGIGTLKFVNENQIQREVCHKHFPEECEMFCTECNETICSSCAVMEHKNHKFLQIEEKIKYVTRKLAKVKKRSILFVEEIEKAQAIHSSSRRPTSESLQRDNMRKTLESAEAILQRCNYAIDISILVAVEQRLEDLDYKFDELSEKKTSTAAEVIESIEGSCEVSHTDTRLTCSN